jgi:malate dehydrogenase (oxaloacetate-decarboxylating)(NADP+)
VRAINLEDITGKGGRCFRIQRELQRRLPIPIFHDDQDGTAIITLAGLLTALEDQGKSLANARLVISGVGAAGVRVARYLLAAGARGEHVTMLDSRGILSLGRPDLPSLAECGAAVGPQREKIELLAEIRGDRRGAWATAVAAGAPPPSSRDAAAVDRVTALAGADVFVGMSAAGILTASHLRSMAPRPIVFACANPDPEIPYEDAVASRADIVVGSGSSLYPNQINNAVAFPGFLAGLMLSGATTLDLEAGVAVARAIAARTRALRATDPSYREIVPRVIDPLLHREVARATVRDIYARGLNRGLGGAAPALREAACLDLVDRRFGGAP